MNNKQEKTELQGIRNVPNKENSYFIELAVKTNANKNCIEEDFGGSLRIKVNAPTIKGKANRAILKLIANKLHISSHDVKIVKGHLNNNKIIQIYYPQSSRNNLRRNLLS